MTSQTMYQPTIVARIPSDIPTDQHAYIHAKIAQLNASLKPSYFTHSSAAWAAENALHGSGITACAWPDAVAVKTPRPVWDGRTFSVVVRDPNSWTQDRDGGNCEYEISAHCGHKHHTEAAAERCLQKLTAWYCNCGERSDAHHRRCSSSTGHTQDSTSARWYHASVECFPKAEIK